MASSHSSQTAVDSVDSQKDQDTHKEQPDEQRVYPNEAKLIAACASGDVCTLRQLLHLFDEKQTDSAVPDDLLPAWTMILTAVEQKQTAIIEILLSTYPQWNMCNPTLLRQAFANPDLKTFELLHSHNPSISNMEFQSSNSTALMESCTGGNPLIPNYLLDHGADVNDGGFPGQGPLYAAVCKRQPVTLVKKMVDLGAIITPAVLQAAIYQQQVSSLEFLLKVGSYDPTNLYVQVARETKNEQIIALMETRAKNLTKAERRLEADRARVKKAESGSRKWWQVFSGKG